MLKLECADNLDFLRTLESKSINLVYSDVLFGTGKKFADFQDLKPDRKIIEDFYYPRIQEIHRVLSDTGTLYWHCDFRISHWCRIILDEVFDYSNFRNEIVWHYNSAPRKKGCFGNRHDTILRYSKSDVFVFNEDEVREPYALSAPRGYEKEKYYNDLGKVLGSVWQINILGQNDKTERVKADGGYSTQKPLSLAERIIKASSHEGNTVADFFLGSGTTAVAAVKLGRNFVGCDSNPKALEITKLRLLGIS